MEPVSPEFFEKHQFKRDDQEMYNKNSTGEDLRKMFKPKVSDDLAATLPDTPEAKQWVDHLRCAAAVHRMCVQEKLDPKYEDILDNFGTTFNVLLEKHPDLVHESLKTS